MERYFLCTYHQMMLIFTYWALGTGLGGQWLHLNPQSSLHHLSDLEPTSEPHRGENGSIQRLTARFTVMTQEKCLAIICSITAPAFTLLIEEMLLWTLPGGAAGILFSIQFTEKLLHIFSSFPCFLSFLNHPTQPGIIFVVVVYHLFIWLLDPSCGMQDLHCVMRDLSLRCTDSPVVAHRLQGVRAQ